MVGTDGKWYLAAVMADKQVCVLRCHVDYSVLLSDRGVEAPVHSPAEKDQRINPTANSSCIYLPPKWKIIV